MTIEVKELEVRLPKARGKRFSVLMEMNGAICSLSNATVEMRRRMVTFAAHPVVSRRPMASRNVIFFRKGNKPKRSDVYLMTDTVMICGVEYFVALPVDFLNELPSAQFPKAKVPRLAKRVRDHTWFNPKTRKLAA